MPHRRRLALSLVFPFLFPLSLAAQGFNLRDLLTEFLREGIVLAPPATGFSHEAHFIGADSPQFQALQQFSTGVANQLSSFPLASSAGGFTYRFDPALGVFTRSADSFGPVYAERADTIGKGKFNLGINFSHFTFDAIDNLSFRDGDVRLVFTHEDTSQDGSNLQFFFEGDVITSRLFLRLDTDITAFVMTYGVSDRFDIGAAIPLVRVELEAQSDATVQRISTGPASTTHRFLNGGTEETIRQSGSASGVGDVVLRGKFRVVGGNRGGLALAADLRLPTGEERDLLGTGATQVTGFLIGSVNLGAFSPHLNAGYTWSQKGPNDTDIPDEIFYRGGFDWALNPRLTLAVDVLGRTALDARVVRVVDTTFQSNTNNDRTTPPVIVTSVFPRLVSEVKDSETLFGSVGFKINPFGNFLLTINGLFSLSDEGLKDDFAPLIGFDYSF